MAYDPMLGEAILFGGAGSDYGCPCYNDTWAFKNGTWALILTPNAPAGRGWAQMAYDANERALILFGGYFMNGVLNDTWRFANGTWRELNNGTSGSPPVTWRGSMTYDPMVGKIVLFGGLQQSPYPRNDTWEYAAGNWTRFIPSNPTLPPVRDGAVLFFDPADHGLVLTGGGYCDAVGCYYFTDTWRFALGNWTPLVNATLPQDAWSTPVAYDSNLGAGVVVSNSGTTWLLRNDSWTNSSLSTFPSSGLVESASASVPGLTPLLVFGGVTSGGSGTNNTSLILGEPNLPLRAFFTGTPRAIDLGQSLQVVVSAEGGNGSLSYAYAGFPPGCSAANVIAFSCTPSASGRYSLTSWVNDSNGSSVRLARSLVVSPPLSVTESFSSYLLDYGGTVALWANRSGGSGVGNVTWSGLPPGECQNRSGSDPIFCTPSIGSWHIRAWSCDSLNQCASSPDLPLTVSPALLLRLWGWTLQGPPAFTEAIVANLSGGSYPVVLQWAFSDGVTSSGTDQNAIHTFPGPGNWSVALTARDATNASAYEEFRFRLSPPSITTPLAVAVSGSTRVIDSGTAVTWAASARGGLGPISYRWGGLPPECLDVSGPNITCTPSSPGIYAPYVMANDTHSDLAWAGSALTVYPRPKITLSSPELFLSCPTDTWVAEFAPISSGGDAPYTWRWSFGDDTFATGTGPINHTYARHSGSYTASVSVTDQLGVGASNSTTFGPGPVTPCPPPFTGSTPNTTNHGYSLNQVLLYAGIALAAGVVVGAAIFLVRRGGSR